MALTWKINGSTLTALGLKNLRLMLFNMQADECAFDDPGAAFDADLVFAYGTDIVVTWNNGGADVCVFRGSVAETPRFLGAKAESIKYKALGRWRDLERIPFVQQFKIADTPSNPASTLSNLPLGLLILHQGDNGASALLSVSLTYVINSAIDAGAAIALGTVGAGLAFAVPWDEATDLSCADAIKRLLQLTPDVVASWDYTVNPPAVSFTRRANLTAVNLPVATAGAGGLGTAYAPLDTVTLTPLYHLQASGVYLIYVRTDRTDGTPWLLVAVDKYPGGTTANQKDAITRTIKLTGAVTQNTSLSQDVTTAALPSAALQIDTLVTAAIDAGNFATLSTFWTKHCPHLMAAGITIKGFRHGHQAPTSNDAASPNAACVRELLAGSITDWMINDQSIQVEEQNVRCQIRYDVITDVNTGAIERKEENLSIQITATNASTNTYTELQDTSYTAPETAPAGLAQAIYNGVSQLHYDGSFDLVGYDPPLTVGVGNTVNLTGSRAEWTGMIAVVQRVSLDVDLGRTTVNVGWPRQLMPADLMAVWRANRTRRPVEDAGARNTGLAGNGTGDGVQSLGKNHHAPAAGAAAHILPSVFTAKVTVAGSVLAVSDLTNALANGGPAGAAIYPPASALATDRFPKSGDQVKFYKAGGAPFLSGTVTCQDPRAGAGDTLHNFAFTANGVSGTFFMHCVQVGAYTAP